jgi:hypothetical protein
MRRSQLFPNVPREMVDWLKATATARRVSVSHLIRTLIKQEMLKDGKATQRNHGRSGPDGQAPQETHIGLSE